MAKAKKKQLSEAAQQKRNEQNKKRINPFEVHINKDKQNVIGRRSKADRGLPGVARARAINKRKGTLLQEYKLKNKDNVFLDKRIGEKNYGMSAEDKAMARFAAERIKAHKKKDIFNLNDEEVLTHRGQTLEEIEKFDDPKSDDEESDDENRTGKLDRKFVGEAHFGGGTLSKPESGKSRKDLIDQLIAESKKRKAEKQKIREQTIDLTEKLDSEWKDLLPIVSAANKSMEEPTVKTDADEYDVAVRKLKFEARGTPLDKLKTEEEIVREEKEKLEALETDRLARMKGIIKGSDSEIRHKSADDLDDGFAIEAVDDEAPVESTNSLAKTMEEAYDDSDNEDSDGENSVENEENVDEEGGDVRFETNETIKETEGDLEPNDIKVNGNAKKKEQILATQSVTASKMDKSEAAHSESDDSSEDDLEDLKGSESSSEDENTISKKNVTFASKTLSSVMDKKDSSSSELKSILKAKNNVNVIQSDNANREEQIRNDLLKRKEIMMEARKELPYTYKAPENFEELHALLQDQNAENQSLIINSIIKCNHWSLDGKNKGKMSDLFLYMLQHINDCTEKDDEKSIINGFSIFDRLCPYLYDLAHVNPESTKTFVQEIIKEKHEAFGKNMKKYPSTSVLLFFKLVSLLFPTSDFRHPVVTPCVIFMSQILLRCRVKNRIDVSKGLFICTLLLEYTVLSKRFVPSVINFLRGVIYMATPKHMIQGTRIIPPFKTIGEVSNLLVIAAEQVDFDINLETPLMKAEDLVCEDADDEFKLRAFLTAMNLLREFKIQLEELEAVYTIFEPFLKLLRRQNFEKYPSKVKKLVKELRKDLTHLNEKKLQYIVREKKKPKPLRMYEPRIEPVYDGKRHKPMSKAKAEREKLLHKYKKEMKGAVREIRRDRAFLAKVQIKQQLKSDAERKRKVKEIFGEAAVQQSEFKKMKTKK